MQHLELLVAHRVGIEAGRRLHRDEAEQLKERDHGVGGKAVIDLTALAPPALHATLARSLFATRPTLNNYVAKRDDLVATAADLFKVVGSGAVKIPINQKYPLKDAARAHKEMEGRDTTGSTILMP